MRLGIPDIPSQLVKPPVNVVLYCISALFPTVKRRCRSRPACELPLCFGRQIDGIQAQPVAKRLKLRTFTKHMSGLRPAKEGIRRNSTQSIV